jgi:hypothetical protein
LFDAVGVLAAGVVAAVEVAEGTFTDTAGLTADRTAELGERAATLVERAHFALDTAELPAFALARITGTEVDFLGDVGAVLVFLEVGEVAELVDLVVGAVAVDKVVAVVVAEVFVGQRVAVDVGVDRELRIGIGVAGVRDDVWARGAVVAAGAEPE